MPLFCIISCFFGYDTQAYMYISSAGSTREQLFIFPKHCYSLECM